MKIAASLIALLVTGAIHAATTQAPNTLSAEQQQLGWKLMFDGKTTAGWHRFNETAIGKAWSVQDGTLHVGANSKDDGGDIVFDGTYTNFDLKVDWKIATAGNSGVMFYVQEGKQYKYPWQTGIESQVLDDAAAEDSKFKHHAADLYDLIPCKTGFVRPANEWNSLELIAGHGHLIEKINGTVVIETTLWDDHWKQLIAGSKFHTMPGFGTFHEGKISLQDHGDEVWFRNIAIRELK